ncbi:restriction endonuclease subunit S [Vibrio jasicida]|uniref:restriction endonuclease subunit S n=1 Tax=Vibrio jasicida TaxID=766224 RepID=UPI000CE4690B|nr:restriction endonuclease subunit S [Vibrio jasicida]CAH1604833.1 Type I restriction-modification system, specificity subunit S [Vibrio jasicida]
MTGRYKAYAEYKESNYEWLGEVPSHWDVAYSKWLFSERNNKANQSDEMLTASQKYGVIPQKLFMKLEQQKVVQVQKGHDILKQVKRNDFVISMRSFQGGIEFCEYDGAVSSAYVPLEPKEELSLSYFKYLFKSKPYIQALQATTNLVRDGQALRYNNFLQVKIPVPERSEAEKIGKFLAHETAKIDTLITKQEKLIELLKEKRQAVISHAVTKGLNPQAPMKDSGVEWLGEVPEHWNLTPLKYLCSFSGGGTPTKDNLSYWTDGTVPWVSPKDMKSLRITQTTDYITEQAVHESSTNFVDTGALLMVVRSGILQRTIPVAINDVTVTLNQDMKALTFNSKMNADFALNFITGYQKALLLEWSKEGATVESIEHEYLANGLLPVPPIDEQSFIVEYLSREMEKFDKLEVQATVGIELLKERKTALISAAVTGKIDVRDWQEPAEQQG